MTLQVLNAQHSHRFQFKTLPQQSHVMIYKLCRYSFTRFIRYKRSLAHSHLRSLSLPVTNYHMSNDRKRNQITSICSSRLGFVWYTNNIASNEQNINFHFVIVVGLPRKKNFSAYERINEF